MSPPGRPKGEFRSAEHEGIPVSPPGRPKGEFRSAEHEGIPVSPPGRPKGEFRSAQHEGTPVSTRLARPWCVGAVWLSCLAAAPAVADPMRPLSAPASAASAADGAAALPAGAAVPEPVLRRLLAIREDNTGARAALFGDRWLRAGDRYTAAEGETLVLSIGAHHIELEQGKVRSTYHLLAPLLPPQWPTQPARAAPGSAAAATRNEKPNQTDSRPPPKPVTTAPRTERPTTP